MGRSTAASRSIWSHRLGPIIALAAVAMPSGAIETELTWNAPRPRMAPLVVPRIDPFLDFDVLQHGLAADAADLELFDLRRAIDAGVDTDGVSPLDLVAGVRQDVHADAGIDRFLEVGLAPHLVAPRAPGRDGLPFSVRVPLFVGIGMSHEDPFAGTQPDATGYIGTGVEMELPVMRDHGSKLDISAGVQFQLFDAPDEDPFRVIGRLGISWRF